MLVVVVTLHGKCAVALLRFVHRHHSHGLQHILELLLRLPLELIQLRNLKHQAMNAAIPQKHSAQTPL